MHMQIFQLNSFEMQDEPYLVSPSGDPSLYPAGKLEAPYLKTKMSRFMKRSPAMALNH